MNDQSYAFDRRIIIRYTFTLWYNDEWRVANANCCFDAMMVRTLQFGAYFILDCQNIDIIFNFIYDANHLMFLAL